VPPINYDKRKSRRKYQQASPLNGAQDAQVLSTIENQPSVSQADASFFKKTSLERSVESGKGVPQSSMNARGMGLATPLQAGGTAQRGRFNESSYARSPLRPGHQKSDYYDHNIRRQNLGQSPGDRGLRKSNYQTQELDEFSEFNQSLKMSMQHPIYAGNQHVKDATVTMKQHI
jgi:hypothetical protein